MDELLKGERSENPKSEEEGCGESGDLREEIKRHLFTRGKDEPKHFSEKICGVLMRRAYALSSVWQAALEKEPLLCYTVKGITTRGFTNA